MNHHLHDQIEKMAYNFWEERGRPLGSPEDDWFRAEKSVRHRELHHPLPLPLSSLVVEPSEY